MAPTPRRIRARALWTPEGVVHDAVVVVDAEGVIVEVRAAVAGDGDAVDGLVVPGLLNAHTHLELSFHEAPVPGGAGFADWAGRAMAVRPGPDAEARGRAAARQLVALGVASVQDVSNGGHTASWLREAGLRGVVHHELLTFDRVALPDRVALARAASPGEGPVVTRPSPHALFSTAPELVVACVRSGPSVPATIHVGEAEDEARFLQDGTGPLADLLDRLGRDWRWWTPPGRTPLGVLDALGVLGPDLLLVHGVRLGAEDIARAAARRAPVCFCPRSNLHVGGRLPDVGAWLAAGVPAVLGTDGLGSTPDLDVLAEIPVLAAAFPDVPATTWLGMVTHDAARALRRVGEGVVRVGARPGLLQLDVGDVADLARRVPGRQWLVPPSAAA